MTHSYSMGSSRKWKKDCKEIEDIPIKIKKGSNFVVVFHGATWMVYFSGHLALKSLLKISGTTQFYAHTHKNTYILK